MKLNTNTNRHPESQISDYAPIAIFCYRRPGHLRKTLKSLMCCEGFVRSPVIVYGDGPRNENEVAAVEETRVVAKTLLGERAEYYFRETNIGLANSVISGVKSVVDRFGRVIVIEDDLELSQNFLTFMNSALNRYANEERVFQISGFMFDGSDEISTQSAHFFPFTTSWGWATWKRAWDQFDPLALDWKNVFADKRLRRQFNLDGVYDYSTMLINQMNGQLDSWAIRWYWTVFKANGLVLFPPKTLVHNRGFDGSGTHGRGILRKWSDLSKLLSSTEITLPDSVTICQHSFDCVKKAVWRQNGKWLGALVDRLRWFRAIYLYR